MTFEDVEKEFGTLYAACMKLNIWEQSATYWRKVGYIPWKQQFNLAVLSNGRLIPDEFDPCPKKPKKAKKQKPRKIKNNDNINTTTCEHCKLLG